MGIRKKKKARKKEMNVEEEALKHEINMKYSMIQAHIHSSEQAGKHANRQVGKQTADMKTIFKLTIYVLFNGKSFLYRRPRANVFIPSTSPMCIKYTI